MQTDTQDDRGNGMKENEYVGAMSFLERAQIFQEKLMGITSLEDLINLSCTVLDASLYIYDSNGVILVSSPIEERACSSWVNSIRNQKVRKEILKSTLIPKPTCNVMPEPQCKGTPCTRMTFPLKIGENESPGVLTFFFWEREINQDDQYLASSVAGTFSIWMRKRFVLANPQISKIRLLQELLEYKPGLKLYYERSIAMEHLNTLESSFRLVYICMDETRYAEADTLVMELQCRIAQAWVFRHKNDILLVYNQQSIETETLCDMLEPALLEMGLTGCLSIEFKRLLELRYVFEDTSVACQIARRKKPDTMLHRAEQYLSLSFLYKCQQYFPLQEYYPAGFKRLIEYDRETGRNYLATLAAFLENNLNVNAAAKAIFMHRNTMTQQLEKIEQIMGLPLKDSETCWYLQLCIRIHNLLEE